MRAAKFIPNLCAMPSQHTPTLRTMTNPSKPVEQLAEQAGAMPTSLDSNPPSLCYSFDEVVLARFAGLVAAECAQACEDALAYNSDDPGETYAAICRIAFRMPKP